MTHIDVEFAQSFNSQITHTFYVTPSLSYIIIEIMFKDKSFIGWQ